MPSISKVTRGRGRRKKKSFLAFLANKAFKNIDVLSQITPFHKPNGGRNKLTHLQLTLSWCVLPLCVKIQYSPKLLKYKRGGGRRLIHASEMNEERLVVPKSHFPHGWASWVSQRDENTLTRWSNRWLDSSCAHCPVPTSISLRVPASDLPDWAAYSLVWRGSAVAGTPPRLWRTTPRVCTPFCHLPSAPPYYLCIPGDLT